MKPLERGHKKLLNAWAFYDWANSVYSLTIVSTIFPIFYGLLFRIAKLTHIELFGMVIKSTSVIAFVTALAFAVVVVLSPILSGIADYLGNKKSFMRFFCYLGAISCVGLYWFSLEHIYFGLLCYFCGVVGFWGSIVFYNSYLPDIALPEQYDAVSAKGYSLGYTGSVLLLIFNLIMVMKPQWVGFATADAETTLTTMRISFITVGIWWIGFSSIPFYYLPSYKKGRGEFSKSILFNGFKELRKVWQFLSASPRLKWYLIAFFVYSMGVQTVMLIATYFGEQEIQWANSEESTMGLIISVLIIQLVAILGAHLTVLTVRKWGNIAVLIGLNVIWVGICLLSYCVYKPTEFYAIAILVGLVMGGIQTLSRSTYSAYLPETKDTTSFFSFYDVTEKLGIVIGMGVYGMIDQFTNNMRNATISLIVFFVLGMLLLFKVRKVSRVANE
ncbi:MFS transporter [Capnocytophaga sp. oral taxon 864]|jgi:MFS transporter|uniref:MFS transporter n=1 Tax=Capnocytophaga sp. oral taxon 864 TaxID=1316593 RepID=UPI000D02D72E|nr:MFS transporter [Capnocytophaga sp. oral taxon 864]AVM54192.1 MFS transporter [Capnocytophaga sp. oral taxon 864]